MSQSEHSILRDYALAYTPPVRASLLASADMNTASVVRDRQLAQTLGVTPYAVRLDRDASEREAQARRIEAHPVLGRYAGLSPENAALVRDDEQGLLGVIRSAASAAWNATKEAGRDIGEAWDAGNRQMELAELGNRLADGDESAQAGIDAWYTREASLPQRETFADIVGLTSAVTQLPRTLKKDMPTSALSAAGGALAGAGGGALVGAAFGGVGAGPGAMAGARLGGKAGWLAGTAQSSYDTERGSFAAELSRERDENGQRLAPEFRNAYSTVYGVAAAAVETLGEAVFLKLISPLAGRTLGKLGVKPFLRSALKKAMWDKSVQAAVLDLSKRFAGGVAGEGAEEAVQQLMSILAESAAKRQATAAGVNAFPDEGLLPPGSGKEALEAGVEGMKAGLWLSGGPTAVLGVAQIREARQVAAWSEAQKNTKAALDQTRIGAASPELSEGFLRRGPGITGAVTLPADAVLELHQSGLDILEPLGWQARDVADAAALGQDLEAPLSRLHARLDAKTFDAVADIMRPEPGTMSAAEAAKLDERLQADVEDVNAAFAEYQAEQNAIDAEVELWRAEVAGAVASVPNLGAAIKNERLTPDAVAETYVAPLLNFAERLQEHAGLPVAETLRKLRMQGLVRDERGRLLTPDEMLEREEARAKAEAEAPFWEAVWGRLDGQSLKRDYPDAWRELSRLHGPRLFAKKGGGLAIDELADEMEGAYLLEQGGGGDALMERLKQGKKPDRTLFQNDPPVVREGITRKPDSATARVVSIPENAVPEFSGMKDFANWLKDMLAEGGDVEILSTGQIARFTSGKVGDSVKRSRSKEHRNAYAALREMIRNAEYDHYEEPDERHYRSGGQDIYHSALVMGGKLYSVKLKLDVVTADQRESERRRNENTDDDVRYKDHKLTEIEIAPTRTRGAVENDGATQTVDAISEITLGILRGSVKPSGIRGQTLFQPLNEGVDLDAPVAVVDVTPRFAGQNPKVLRKRFPEDVRRAVLAEFESPEGVVNADTGKRVGMSATDFHEHLKFSDADAVGGLAQLEAVAALPDLMRTAKLVESYEDRKGTGSIKKMHRFQAALRIGDKDYSVKLTVKEYKDGSLELDSKTPFKIYHHRLEKEMPAGNSTALSQDDQPPQPSAGIHEYSLRALLEDVKDSEGQAFFQSAYHGSPHRFDRFSLDAIGTGEGTQAHGWGLYFAADRKASEEYRRNLGVTISLDGKTLYDGVRGRLESSTGNRIADDELLAAHGNIEEAIAEVQDDVDYGVPEAVEALEVLRAIKADNRLQVEERGQLFAVDIPENDVLLDEQKKFSEQPEKVKDALKRISETLGEYAPELRNAMQGYENANGRNLYWALTQDMGGTKAASEALNEYGVKGIAYEGGRDGRCFVVFDDAAIKVMETYYQSKEYQTSDEAFASGAEAMKQVINQQADVLDAMFRPDVGSISFYWGTPGKGAKLKGGSGVSHLIARRNAEGQDGEAVALNMVEVLAYGEMGPEYGPQGGQHRNVSYAGHTAVLSLYRFGNRETWLLTGWKDNPVDESGAVNASNSTQTGPSGIRGGLGATGSSANSIQPLGADGKPLFHNAGLNVRASIRPVSDGYLIQLFPKADLSSLLHEMGHFFLLEVDDAVRAGLADDALQADYATLRQWLKVEDGAELTREQHEQFARGFEAYLMEGKAPSASLESAFARFKKWLTRIYKKARALNVDLTDEVRGVFDRLLATDAEVNARAVENGLVDLTARELDALGLKGAERASVSGLMRAACDAAEARMRADRDRQRREQVRQWAAEARAEVDADPLYGAMKDARAGGLDLEAVRQDMGEDYAARLMKRLPVAFRKEGGADPAMFAAEHGFRDPADLFRAMLDAPTKAARVRAIVDAKQQAWDANFDPADYLMETDEAARQMERVGQYVARALGSQTADQRALKRVAAMSMGKATQPGTYRMNMRRALTAERRAIVRGEWQAALEANFQARINMEFARQSLELKRSVEKLQGRIKRFTGMARADPDARFLVGALAQRHGLGRLDARLATEERQNPGDVLAAWIEGAKADGCPVIMDNAFARPDLLWRDMSVETFEQLAETVGQIVTVERNRRKLLTAQGKADLDEAAEEIAAGVAAFRESAPVKTVEKENPALKSLKGLHAIHAKVEALCLALDGDKQGPMWEYVYRPVTKAEDDQSGRLRTARDKLRRLFGVFSRKELSAMRLNREYVAGVGERLTRENMIALALNMGNETNIARVREGHGWTDAQIGDVLSRLTRKDWDFVQSVWDYFETFRDESFKLQEDVTGLRPQAVAARPLTVTTADGHTLTLRGGYFPIRYNAEKGFLAFEREQRELDQELFGGNNHSAAMTRQGHLKERARKGTGEPLLLELSVVTDHVFNVIHDLSYRRAVLDVAKVIRHPKVREALAGAVGMDMVNQLKPWLMDVANERQEPMHAVHRWANWARASTSIMQMGWKVTTMLAQPLGILQTAEALGYGYTAAGLKKVYGNLLRLPELLEETFARSPMMADRIRSFDREIRDMTKKLMPSSGLFGWVDKVRDSAFVPIGVMQMGVDLPAWWGGYAKGLRDFQGDEARAAEYADSVVRMSQGSGSTKDLARVQRGGPLPRLFTMFYSYFNTFYNLAARRFTALRKDRSPAAVFRAANTALLLWFVPAVLGELMAGRAPDDDDEWDEWAGMLIMQYPFQAVVGVRDVANHVFGEYGYQITPAQAAPKALGQWFKSVNKALEEEDAGRLVKPTVEAAGYLFGLPMKQPIITVGNMWDYLTGEDPEFEVRDLFFVKPRDRR